MSAPDFGFLAIDDLPPHDHIVSKCREDLESGGIPLFNRPGGAIIAWVTFGPGITLHQALTQDFAAKKLGANPATLVQVPRVHDFFSIETEGWGPIGFIVMEYVDAPDCTSGDVQLVANTVQTLISIQGPTTIPGHLGGGPVVHSFFLDDGTSPFKYRNVNELESHINRILKVENDRRRVNLVADAIGGLLLCPCDMGPHNFKKHPDGRVTALNFRASCFLPPSFFAVTMAKAWDTFTQRVAKRVEYTISNDVAAMTAASYYLVPFGRNDIGAPKGVDRHEGL